MNKQELLQAIAKSVLSKYPWSVSQEKYLKLFGELPREFLDERLVYDNLLEKMKKFKLCNLIVSQVKIEIKLNWEELIIWELNLDKFSDAKLHNIIPGDIKKILKDYEI